MPDPRQLIFFCLGIAMCAGALYWFVRQRQFRAQAARAPGKIVSLKERRLRYPSDMRIHYYPVVRFEDAVGREHEFTSTTMSPYRNRWWVGQPVNVAYDPANPADAQISGTAYSYAGPAIIMVIGLVFALLGGGFSILKALPVRLDPGAFAGQWTNADGNAGDITRIEIGSSLYGVELKVWGKCQPHDCDWGSPVLIENVDTAKGSMTVWWDHRFARRNQKVALQADGRLQVVTQTHFVEQPRRRDYQTTEYFVRAPR